MGSTTPRFGLALLTEPTDSVADNDYHFGGRDRRFVDQALAYAIEAHVHDGRAQPNTETVPTSTLNLIPGVGQIPAGATAYYRCALVDNRGHELNASQIVRVATAMPVPSPTELGLTIDTTMGELIPGTYTYALSAAVTYSDPASGMDNETESTVSPTRSITLPIAGRILIRGPEHTAGDPYFHAFNAYRRGPGDADFGFIGSGTGIREDYSADQIDPDRHRPTANTTNSHNSVGITLATPLPDGYTWRVYRSYNQARWDNSLLYWGTTTSITDAGGPTRSGTPLDASAGFGSPPKIDLGAATTGKLPPGANTFALEVVFVMAGPLVAGLGNWWWYSPYRHAEIMSIQAWLDRDAIRDATPIESVLADNFNRPDGGLGNSPAGAPYEGAGHDNFQINSNAARSSGASEEMAVFDSGFADVSISVTHVDDITNNGQGIVARWVDNNNFIIGFISKLSIGGVRALIYTKVAGTYTERASTSTTSSLGSAAGKVTKLVVSGASIALWFDGVLQLSITDPAPNLTATRHGIYSGSETARLDNLTVTGGTVSVTPVEITPFLWSRTRGQEVTADRPVIPVDGYRSEVVTFDPSVGLLNDESLCIGLDADPGTLVPADANLYVGVTMLVAGALADDDIHSLPPGGSTSPSPGRLLLENGHVLVTESGNPLVLT